MDRLNQIRGEAGSSQDLTLDSSSPLSEAFLSANESSSKYFSLSEVDSTFNISPPKNSITTDADRTITADTSLIPELSPIPKRESDSYKIGKQIEAANILSGGVNIFDDNDNSYDGDELVIDDNVVEEEKSPTELKHGENAELPDENLEDEVIPSRDTEVVLQIDGNNVHAIDIGNGLYLYRKAGGEELAVVQMINDDQQQPSFKFLKVRENAEGNLEVYEEIEVEVTKEVPVKEGEIPVEKSHVPIKDISKVMNEPSCSKVIDNTIKTPKKELSLSSDIAFEMNVDAADNKTDVSFNGKMKFNESRKSPVIGTYTPMTYHSTPNKEGIPLTKTMVDQQLHPSRHTDNVKKTIEVHTDSPKQKLFETQTKTKKCSDAHSSNDDIKESDSAVKNLDSKTDDTTNIKWHKNDQSECMLSEKLPESPLQLLDNINKNSEPGLIEAVTNENVSKSDDHIPTKKTDNDSDELLEIDPKVVFSSTNNKEFIETLTEEGSIDALPTEHKSEVSVVPYNDNIKEDIKPIETNEPNKTTSMEGHECKSHTSVDKKDSLKSLPTEEVDGNLGIDVLSNQKYSEIANKIVPLESVKTLTEDISDVNQIVVNETKVNQIVDSKELNTESNNSDLVSGNENITEDKLTDNNGDNKELIVNNLSVEVISKKSENQIESTKINVEESNNKKDLDTKNTEEPPKMSEMDEVYENKIEETPKMSEMDEVYENKIDNIIEDNLVLEQSSENINTNDVLEKNYDNKCEDNRIPESGQKYKNGGENNSDNKIPIKKDFATDKQDIYVNSCIVEKSENVSVPTVFSIEVATSEIPDYNKASGVVNEQKGTDTNKYENVDSTPKTILVNHIKTDKQNSLQSCNVQDNISKVDVKSKSLVTKALNNNTAVPFGKWTEANRQEFLNKIKETKIPTNNSNTKQLKQPNDLNRRDVLKKIDSQRQSNSTSQNKVYDSSSQPKLNTKKESAVFVSKSIMVQQYSTVDSTVKAPTVENTIVKSISSTKPKQDDITNVGPAAIKNIQRKEINNQDLIDKTIEGIINRAIIGKGTENTHEKPPVMVTQSTKLCPVSLDDIEMKMNDIHGVTGTEQTLNEHTYANKSPLKAETVKAKKIEKVPKLLPFKNKIHSKVLKDNVRDDISEDEIIEHEPITGDHESNKQSLLLPNKNKTPESKKETIITEKDFDKFARRNSITYENCLTISFDGKESHNVIQTIVEKEPPVKKLSRNELMLAESKAKSSNKHLNMPVRTNTHTSRIPTLVKAGNDDDAYNKNNHSKVQMAYQTALTAKRNLECPITIIEDKPVKVVFMNANAEFTPTQLNVQGQELSPPKGESDIFIHSTSESLDSDVLESTRNQEETKIKSKHQRKQVLTPVQEPEIEIIEPVDLDLHVSPKKKRRCEEKFEKQTKNVVPKKSYLLNRNVNDEKLSNKIHDLTKKCGSNEKEPEKRSESFIAHTDTISTIDDLVKAAELIENQSENKNNDIVPTPEKPLTTPVKRGRGRPRKYPLVESGVDRSKAPSPQKKPRLIDAKRTKSISTDSDDSSDEVTIKENWTMGKINENIVCPICNKLFRSENVVFKHVKHCPGPSPNRSDSDKRSPVRRRRSPDSDGDSRDSVSDFTDDEKEEKPRSRRSRFTSSKLVDNDVIVIEDTPIKEKQDQEINQVSKKLNIKIRTQPYKTHNLICEFCGKTFRQLSYLVNHKMQQHKKDTGRNAENEQTGNKTVFSCEVCKKDFRKLHHLVHHRLIHNSNPNNVRVTRKSSSEQHDVKPLKYREETKPSNDASAGFRCEPCDKSFRKLHHLVEHRETHDGINKKSSATSISIGPNSSETVNLPSTYNCDTCKKAFKKLQDLLEHKELHFETSSEKSDDKSVKSSLSTKDIIHECSLCYMVFPNEHSLNKHTVICLRKKKQSAAKAAKQALEKGSAEVENIVVSENEEEREESPKMQVETEDIQIPKTEVEESISNDQEDNIKDAVKPIAKHKIEGQNTKRKHSVDAGVPDVVIKPETENKIVTNNIEEASKKCKEAFIKPAKLKKTEIVECIVIPDTPTPKKILVKDKITATVKKNKAVSYSKLPVAKDPKPTESSDDDDIRYMLNPNFKREETSEAKVFMKVRAKKRNSLQIERPNSKDLVKRRISLQHPPKIPRLKAKAIETKPFVETKIEKTVKETIPSTDSDDSDVKYSFPEPASTEANKDKKKRQSIPTKRKSISGIAKRKSLSKHKVATPKTRKRTTEVEHRCDCGQLFSSAALLSRHTTLAHTPPRIRRRRSPPPEINKPKTKPKQVKRKSDVSKSNTKGVATRKSSVNNSDVKVTSDATKKCEFGGKSLRSSTIRVPVFDKTKKVMEKTKK